MQSVLFVTRKWPPAVGGMETYSVALARELAAKCDLTVHALPGRENGRPPRLWRLVVFMLTSVVAMFKRKYDVIHIGDLVLWPLAAIGNLFRRNTAFVVTAYGLDIVYGHRKGLLPAIYRFYLASGVALVGRKLEVIAISSATAELCRDVGFTNVSVVKLGVQMPEVEPDSELQVKPYVLFVGRLVERKGAAWFAQHVLPLLDDDVEFWVVGKPWEESELEAISSNSRVSYKGVLSSAEIAELREAAIAVVMPNIPTGGKDIEGFGLTALEAAADGGVLLASGIEGIRDAVIDGVTGFLLPANAAHDWADKIKEVSRWDSRDRIAFIRHARETIHEEFSWDRVSRDTLYVYQTCQEKLEWVK